ncbi:hypothetical protein [Gimesia maris]|uniref:hypothetical protein n=1 Tax=Gimesia maris TaxID=122 RepID=UPI00015427E6|nr:hypothetical protein [Gimesia maris]EDL58983.1 hypothetical protein PM8797T_30087 [Gimesia maris DSM 8797]
MFRRCVSFSVFLILVCGSSLWGEKPSATASSAELTFRLPTTSGETVELKKQPDQKVTVVCFLGAECPLARLYGPRLNELQSPIDREAYA